MLDTVQPTPRSRLGAWLHERLGLQGLAYAVPEHANSLPYLFGGITLTGFIILFITGIYLAQFFHAHPTDAHQSVVYIITGAPLGDLVRSIHFWTAQIVTVTVLLHMLRVLFTGAYKRPREINWYVGLGLLAVTLGLVFTGSVLKFDQEGVEALQHNKEAANIIGALGAWFSAEFSRSVVLLALVPILDRSPYLSPVRRGVLLIVAGLILVVIVISGVVATLQPVAAHLE